MSFHVGQRVMVVGHLSNGEPIEQGCIGTVINTDGGSILATFDNVSGTYFVLEENLVHLKIGDDVSNPPKYTPINSISKYQFIAK